MSLKQNRNNIAEVLNVMINLKITGRKKKCVQMTKMKQFTIWISSKFRVWPFKGYDDPETYLKIQLIPHCKHSHYQYCTACEINCCLIKDS